jgi:hypothetical protein
MATRRFKSATMKFGVAPLGSRLALRRAMLWQAREGLRTNAAALLRDRAGAHQRGPPALERPWTPPGNA